MNQVRLDYSFTICLGYPVDIEVTIISLVMKEVAWHLAKTGQRAVAAFCDLAMFLVCRHSSTRAPVSGLLT